jgi:hypothetical protein
MAIFMPRRYHHGMTRSTLRMTPRISDASGIELDETQRRRE